MGVFVPHRHLNFVQQVAWLMQRGLSEFFSAREWNMFEKVTASCFVNTVCSKDQADGELESDALVQKCLLSVTIRSVCWKLEANLPKLRETKILPHSAF